MKLKFNTDRIIGLSAMLISLITLFIFFYQTNLLKEQSRLEVRPRLSFNKTIDKNVTVNDSITTAQITIQVSVRNNGLGPAIIESCAVDFQNNEHGVSPFFEEKFPKLKEYGTFTQLSDLAQGGAIPAEASVTIFTYQYDIKDQDTINKYLGVAAAYEFPFELVVEYSSLYEEKWSIRSSVDGHPVKLD